MCARTDDEVRKDSASEVSGLPERTKLSVCISTFPYPFLHNAKLVGADHGTVHSTSFYLRPTKHRVS